MVCASCHSQYSTLNPCSCSPVRVIEAPKTLVPEVKPQMLLKKEPAGGVKNPFWSA